MKTKRIRDIFGYKDNISYEIAFAKQNYCSIHGNNIHEVPYNASLLPELMCPGILIPHTKRYIEAEPSFISYFFNWHIPYISNIIRYFLSISLSEKACVLYNGPWRHMSHVNSPSKTQRHIESATEKCERYHRENIQGCERHGVRDRRREETCPYHHGPSSGRTERLFAGFFSRWWPLFGRCLITST